MPRGVGVRVSSPSPGKSNGRGQPGIANAEIAQLVEHNLAKVGVASSSLVFRSYNKDRGFQKPLSFCPGGGMVDACVSGAHVARRAGSSPVLGTTNTL